MTGAFCNEDGSCVAQSFNEEKVQFIAIFVAKLCQEFSQVQLFYHQHTTIFLAMMALQLRRMRVGLEESVINAI